MSSVHPPDRVLMDAVVRLTGCVDGRSVCSAMLDVAECVLAARSGWILLHDPETDDLTTFEVRGPCGDSVRGARIPCDHGIAGLAFKARQPVFVPDVLAEQRWFDAERVRSSGLRSVVTVPLAVDGDVLGIMGLESPRFSAEHPPNDDERLSIRAVGAIGAVALRNARLVERLESERARLRSLLDERRELRTAVGQLRSEVRHAHLRDVLVGNSRPFRDVMAQVVLVAPADSTVLLEGETGTGKELIAHELHDRSRRSGGPFVAVNCAALPEALVESELFGYERGAFTGALMRKPGRFELADHGTLFLDEIGDLPLDAQAKLLRVLQEREVQRVGGTTTIPVDVRLIAATNQDLFALTREGRFRTDLFYRLSVFPIVIPPLRDRPEDVPLLVRHFVQRFAERLQRPVPRLGEGVLERLVDYAWPGNVRELQNVVERAVILTRGAVMTSDVILLHPAAPAGARPAHSRRPAEADERAASGRRENVLRFSDAERMAILRALERTGWRISGGGGAADMLGLRPTTLHAKMKKLGIRRPSRSIPVSSSFGTGV